MLKDRVFHDYHIVKRGKISSRNVSRTNFFFPENVLFSWGSDGLVISTEIWFLSNDWWPQCGVNITWHELSGWGNQRGWSELDGRWRWNGLWYMVGLVTTSWFIISMWFSPVAGRQQLRLFGERKQGEGRQLRSCFGEINQVSWMLMTDHQILIVLI